MFGAEISDTLADEFLQHCEQKRYLKFGAIEGALRAFMALPAELQVRLMSNKFTGNIYQLLVEGLVDVELARELAKMGSDKQEFLALVRQAKAKVSRKK
jgi:hypothetical protein